MVLEKLEMRIGLYAAAQKTSLFLTLSSLGSAPSKQPAINPCHECKSGHRTWRCVQRRPPAAGWLETRMSLWCVRVTGWDDRVRAAVRLGLHVSGLSTQFWHSLSTGFVLNSLPPELMRRFMGVVLPQSTEKQLLYLSYLWLCKVASFLLACGIL